MRNNTINLDNKDGGRKRGSWKFEESIVGISCVYKKLYIFTFNGQSYLGSDIEMTDTGDFASSGVCQSLSWRSPKRSAIGDMANSPVWAPKTGFGNRGPSYFEGGAVSFPGASLLTSGLGLQFFIGTLFRPLARIPKSVTNSWRVLVECMGQASRRRLLQNRSSKGNSQELISLRS